MDGMDRLADVLGRERLLMEQVVFKLTQLRHLLLAGDGRFLAWASDELQHALQALGEAEVVRAVVVLELAEALGLDDGEPTLAEIVTRAAPPWSAIMADHRAAMVAMHEEIRGLTAGNRRLAEAGHRIVTEALDRASGLTPSAEPATGGRWDTVVTDARLERRL